MRHHFRLAFGGGARKIAALGASEHMKAKHGFSLLASLRRGALSRGAVRAAVLALLFQFAIPLFHVPPAAAGGSEIAICHFDGGAQDQQKPGDQLPLCPICLGLQLAGTFIAPAAPALSLPAAIPMRRPIAHSDRTAFAAHPYSGQPRAPPAI